MQWGEPTSGLPNAACCTLSSAEPYGELAAPRLVRMLSEHNIQKEITLHTLSSVGCMLSDHGVQTRDVQGRQ